MSTTADQEAENVAARIKAESQGKFCLKDHQISGLSFMIKSMHDEDHGCIMADEMGLGKTCQAVSFIVYLNLHKKTKDKYIILCPLSVLQHWTKELQRFGCGIESIVYQGVKEEREKLREKIERNDDWQVILTSYEMALKDKEFFEKYSWRLVIVDEAHRLKNSESLLHQNLQEFKVKHFLLLTGTPVQNNLNELYSLMSLIDTSKFPEENRKKFLQRFSNTKDTKKLREMLENYMIRRTKDVVCPDIPEKSEVVLFHGMSDMQKTLYKAVLAKNRDVFITKNKQKLMNTLMQLRKCVCHPYLFDGVEPEPFEEGDHLIVNCGKLIVLDRLLSYLNKHKHKVLLFSQMTRVLDILQDYLAYRGYTYERLDGSVRGEERYAAISRFSSNTSTFCFLLSTKAGGLGLTLTAADTVIFFDSDFNPQNDLQAAARAHRIGQEKPVKIIRLVARHTVEEYILKRAGQKMQLTNAILKNNSDETSDQLSAAEISEMLMFGLSKLIESGVGDDVKMNEGELTKLIGESKNGLWENKPILKKSASIDVQTEEVKDIYDYEGKNYRKEAKESDEKVLVNLLGLENAKQLNKEVYTPLGRQKPPPKILTPEELERRRLRMEEMAELRKLRETENRKKKEEYAQILKQKLYDRYNYVSACLPDAEEVETKDDEEEIDVDEENKNVNADLIYVVGDVSKPKLRAEHENMDAVVVHCVDNSGRWGNGGVFDSLARRSPKIVDTYKTAGKVDDLELGDIHLLPLDDVESRKGGRDFAALIVAQHHKNRNELKYSSLETALKRLGEYASKHQCTVHMPRIGFGLAKFNWYGTERMIRKFLCRHNVPTYIYYFSRHAQKRAVDEETEKEEQTPPPHKQSRHSSEIELLPSIFEGMSFCGFDLPEEASKRLARFVVAYDGSWTCNQAQADVTHIVAENKASLDTDVKESFAKSGKVVVTRDWLERCVKAKCLLPNSE